MTNEQAGVALAGIIRWASEAGLTWKREADRARLLALHKAATEMYPLVQEAELLRMQLAAAEEKRNDR